MISIITPTHDSRFLAELYDSLRNQKGSVPWEWIIVFNNGAEPVPFQDDRIKPHILWKSEQWVGPLKAFACSKAAGDIILELDHDDLLTPDALEEVEKAFADPDVGFAYSNTVHALLNGSCPRHSKVQRFSEVFGWKYREVEFEGALLDEHISFPPTPESVSRIWFAPNHLRAWRRELYERIGGHSKDMRILDDLDLMCRMYAESKFKHIDKPLYVYRVHGQNTWLKPDINKEIQGNVYRIYDQYIYRLVERWAAMNGYRKIELGGRMAAQPGYETVDLKDADIIWNLNKRWPFKDSSVGVFRAFDVFEHLRDPLHTMKEVYRCLAPGGWLFCQVPSAEGTGAFSDPTHVSFWNERSFKYYTEARLAKYIDTPVRFQAPRLYTTAKDSEGVCWVRADLISCKDGYRPCGLLEI